MSKQNAILQPLGMAMILALGFGVAIFLLVIWGVAIYETTKKPHSAYEEVLVLKDGTPVIYTYDYYDGSTKTDYRTLEGNTLPSISNFRDRQIDMTILPGQDTFKDVRLPLEGISRTGMIALGNPWRTLWYFIHDGNREGKGYFIGYDLESKHCIGFLGRNGFSQSMPAAEDQFLLDARKFPQVANFVQIYSESYNAPSDANLLFLLSGNQVMRVDLAAQTVTPLMKSPDIVSLGRMNVDNADPEKNVPGDLIYNHYLLAVRMQDRILFINNSGKRVGDYIIPEELRNRSFNMYRMDDKKAILVYEDRHSELTYDEKIAWIDASGKIIQEKIAFTHSDARKPSIAENREITLSAPSPIVAPVVGMIFNKNHWINYSEAFYIYMSNSWKVLLVIVIVSAVLAWICNHRQRRMALPWTWVWVGFVFLFGVPGFLAYRFHRRWPVLENCYVCGNAVPHDREKCSSCGSEFPAPAPKGIEVFA